MTVMNYTSHGKLLLTGEYLVLNGAVALALPVCLGQSMTVAPLETFHNKSLRWDAHTPDAPWFSATLDKTSLEILVTDDPSKAERLKKILKAVQELNPSAFGQALHFVTHLDFNPEWGLGSSSTLISNLAQWAKVDPYKLLKMTFGGSGYDIACATADSPIFYQLVEGQPRTEKAMFHPSFSEHLFFVYQGKKQNSAKEVSHFKMRMQDKDLSQEIVEISDISRALPDANDLPMFCSLLDQHEAILSRCLDHEPLKSQYPDFPGTIKSLGAWGGDFFLAATAWDEKAVKAYFTANGLEVIVPYKNFVS